MPVSYGGRTHEVRKSAKRWEQPKSYAGNLKFLQNNHVPVNVRTQTTHGAQKSAERK